MTKRKQITSSVAFTKPPARYKAMEVKIIDMTKKTGKKKASTYPLEKMKFRMHEDLKTLRYAEDDFENIYQYQRWRLHQIFRLAQKDPHLTSQWETRKMKTTQRKFKITDKHDGIDENADLTLLLQTGWFREVLGHCLDSKLNGFSFIEFGPYVVSPEGKGRFIDYQNDRGRWFPGINLIDADYVKPEFNCIVKEIGEVAGLQIDDASIENTTLFVGGRHDAGLMMKIVKWILFKDNCAANWSEWAEIFGMDLRIGKTKGEGEDKKRFLYQLRDIGSSGYGVIDSDDEIEFHGSTHTDAFQVYKQFIDYIDTQISKAIFGQDVITNNTGQVVGKVGENVSKLYADADAEFLELIINDFLLPLFTRMGVGNFTGKFFRWDQTEKLSLLERSDVDAKIKKMGWTPTKEYIQETYGTEVEDQKEEVETDDEGNPIKPGKKPPVKKPVKKNGNK